MVIPQTNLTKCQHAIPSSQTGSCARSIRLIVMLLCVAFFGASGCARRAYNDVYVDNMAAEIRDLEDQLYQYDHEFRVVEQELLDLQAENQRLRSSVSNGNSPNSRTNGPSGDNRSLLQPNGPSSASPSSNGTMNSPSMAPAIGSGVPSSDGSSSILDKSPSSPVPNAGRVSPSDRMGTESGLVPNPEPSNLMPLPAAGADQAPAQLPPSRSPSASPTNTLPAPKRGPNPSELDSIDLNSLSPPAIETGYPMPPPVKAVPSDISNPIGAAERNQLELEVGRINLPASLASAPKNASATIRAAAEIPRDTRLVDLKFHPALCRSANFDSQDDDDGLSLVLQPCNEQGQFVPTPADLSLWVIDPAREGEKAYISKWNFSAAEVKSKLQPIGSSQGIHLSLPWNGPDPIADQVVVFARYTLPDGRQLVSEKTIYVSGPNRVKTVWVPRSGSQSANVRQASNEESKGTRTATPLAR